MSLHGYELIDTLKNLISILVLGTKELSLVILGITELYCDICLFVQELNAVNCWCLLTGVLFSLCEYFVVVYKFVYIFLNLILRIPLLDFLVTASANNNTICELF